MAGLWPLPQEYSHGSATVWLASDAKLILNSGTHPIEEFQQLWNSDQENNSHWYLDGGHGGGVDPDPANPKTPVKSPFLDWCSPYKNWREVSSHDPLDGVPKEHAHLVLGGEAHLWCEMTDSVTLDGMLWPRVAAAAEVLWRGRGHVGEETTRRLAKVRERLVAEGVAAGMVQMEWCLRNPGGGLL